jgi:hypothetical protein
MQSSTTLTEGPNRIYTVFPFVRLLDAQTRGSRLATRDFSAVKDTTVHERLTLQFRGEIFNLLNRANFNTPNLVVFTPSGVSGTAGAINSTATTSRQVQLALKLLW